MNITLGHGKAVHAVYPGAPGFMPNSECGGNRAVERYYETSREVTCKKCLKALAKRAEEAEVETAEVEVEQAAPVEAPESDRDDRARTNARVAEINAAPVKAEPFRPAYKTVTKVEVSYVLQSSTDGELWSFVSSHATEKDATVRARGMLSRGCGLKFRVAEHRFEVRATEIIEAPSQKPEAAYRVDQDTWDGYAVYETATDRCVYRSMSRYGAQTVCDGLNSGEMVLRDGTVVQA